MSLTSDDKKRIRFEELFRAEIQKELAGSSHQPDFLDQTIIFFRSHPALVGTLLYLQISTIGFIHNAVLFSKFGINVFEFAELNDFLLAAFKQPFVIGMAFISLAMFIAYAIMLALRRRRREAAGLASGALSSRFRKIYFTMFLVVGIVYTFYPPYIYASGYARKIYAEKEPLVTVMLNSRAPEQAHSAVLRPVTLIGTTEKFAFFYDQDSKLTITIPVATIAALTQSNAEDSRGTESTKEHEDMSDDEGNSETESHSGGGPDNADSVPDGSTP